MKYLFISLEVYDGERIHDHRILETTNGKDIYFAAQKCAATYWGLGKLEDEKWWFNNEIAIKLKKVEELTKEKFDELWKLFYH